MGTVKEPETEYGKFILMISMYEKILHPDVFRPLMTQLYKVYDEYKKEAYANANISDEALKIEEMLKRLKQNMQMNQDTVDADRLNVFHIKCMYKDLLKLFKNDKELKINENGKED